ncbi:hypothetical protein [Marichromatium gracile]|uniref:Alginate export domain-containing protein n=1 Tax=Marichromatium gracile TaxID=1048 RepID=A0ABR5VL37_MARGR|nr:hypothetical protein [Marichromatium gracile]KXX66418.1 hypothetical protein AY586_00425 [Marichromatium gracile]
MGIRPARLAALLGLLAAPAAQAIERAVEYDFSGDFDVRTFNRDPGVGDTQSGFEQRLRLRGSLTLDDRVSLHAGVNLTNDTWRGDESAKAVEDEEPFTIGRTHRTVTFDYGYVELPFDDWKLRVGRQIANWNFDMTVSDDRRDRIMLLGPVGEDITFILGGDQRQNTTYDDRLDDGYLVFSGFVGKTAGWSWGALLGHYIGDDERAFDGSYQPGYFYTPRSGTLVSPWAQGRLGPVEITTGAHYLGGGDAIFTNNTFAGFLRGGYQATPELLFEAQGFFNLGGSLIEPGFDSFSSLIHNSPRHDASATRIPALDLTGVGKGDRELGGIDQDFDRYLLALRGSYSPTDKWRLQLAGGWVRYDGLTRDLDEAEDVVFGDVQLSYQVTRSTRIWGSYGYAATSDLIPGVDSVDALSLNLRTEF